MSERRALVEHFFCHEFGRLGAVLTRSLGVRRLDLLEDVVQAALVRALEAWSRRGVPEDPAGCRNLAIDALRRERTHAQALLIRVEGGPVVSLTGEYWTDRMTRGELRFMEKSETLYFDFVSASAGTFTKSEAMPAAPASASSPAPSPAPVSGTQQN